jgi:hypothetical protein
VVGNGDLAPRQGGELVVQGGLVALHDQQIGGVLLGDQPVGVLALGVQRVGGDHGADEVQAVQQRLELGDLVGGVVDVGLGEDRAAGVVHRRASAPLPCGGGIAAGHETAVLVFTPKRPLTRRAALTASRRHG